MDEAIIIDRMEAKTLNLCVEATTSLVKEDIQSFVDLPLEVRIRIFIQLTQILCLSFSLYSLFKQRTLTQYDFLGNESGSGNYKHGLTFGGGMNISTHIGVNQKKKQKQNQNYCVNLCYLEGSIFKHIFSIFYFDYQVWLTNFIIDVTCD